MPAKKRTKASGGVCKEPSKLKLGELKEELGNLGLDITGKKAELVARLEEALKGEEDPPPSKKVKVEAVTAGTVDYSKMKVPELKKELESRGMDTAGKKVELVARLEGGGGDATTKKEAKEEEPVDETDFSKAMRALSSADSGKKKKKKTKARKVDGSAPPGHSVVDDWDCMLNQTNIGHNNNKFYVIQLLVRHGVYYVWTRWGRVGEPGQNALKMFKLLPEAEKEFKKKFSDKTKNKWETRDKFVPAPGKYTLIEMDEEDEEMDQETVSKLEALDEPDSGVPVSVVTKPCSLEKPTQDLIKLIFNNDMFNHALKSMEIDTKKMPLGKLGKTQIAKGFEALEALETALDASAPRVTLADLTSKFYTIIPHDFGRKTPAVICNKEMLQKKFDMLVILGDIELAQGMQKDQEKKKTEGGTKEVPHVLDVNYESLKTDLTLLDKSSHEYTVVSKYTEATKCRSLKLLDVWRVDRDNVDERFKAHDSITRRSLLWHGTNVAVVAAILKSGLRIMPHSGGRVGRGIYHASENGKSAAYVRGAADGTAIMFLNEVALGKENEITMDDHRLIQAPPGFDSVVARGRTEPDSKLDTTLILDGKPVTVPQGPPINTSYTNSSFFQSEYLVYKESQSRIRYMLRIKF